MTLSLETLVVLIFYGDKEAEKAYRGMKHLEQFADPYLRPSCWVREGKYETGLTYQG